MALVYTLLILSQSAGPEPLHVAVHVPSVYFSELAAKADFVSGVEEALSERLKRPVRAVNTRDVPERGAAHLWVVDATAAALHGDLLLVRQASFRRQTELPMAIYATKEWRPLVDLLRGRRFAYGSGEGTGAVDLIANWLLAGEPGATDIAARVRMVTDAHASLLAVAAGELDGALAFRRPYSELAPQLASVRELGVLGHAPLPLLAVDPQAFSSRASAAALSSALERVSLPRVEGVIGAWAAPDRARLEEFGRLLRAHVPRISRTLRLAELPPFALSLVGLLPVPEGPPALTADLVMPAVVPQQFPDLPSEDQESTRQVVVAP